MSKARPGIYLVDKPGAPWSVIPSVGRTRCRFDTTGITSAAGLMELQPGW